MKVPCEQIIFERERFLINLRKSKRQDCNTNKRKLYGGNIKSDLLEIKVLIDRVLVHLETNEGLSQVLQYARNLSIRNLIPIVLETLTKSIKSEENLLEPVYLEFLPSYAKKRMEQTDA